MHHEDFLNEPDPVSDHPVGWGIVGCGWVARDYVAPALAAAPSARLLALCDPDPHARGRLRPLAAPGATEHADWEAFLATPGLEAVYVATPNHLHAALTAAAAAAGKHVLCEKPMATTYPDAVGMVAACRTAGVQYATAFDQRFHAAHRRLRALVRSGRLGTVTSVRVHYACWTPADWAPPTDDGRHDNWRVDPARAGGGAFVDLAPHGLDLTQHLLDDELVEVACLRQRQVFAYPVDDGAALVGRFRGGALLVMNVAYNCPDALPRRTLELVGTGAMVVARDTMGQTPGGSLRLWDARTGEESAVPVPAAEDVSPFERGVELFSRCVRRGVPFPFSPERDLHTMRLLAAAAGGAEGPASGRDGSAPPAPAAAGTRSAEPAPVAAVAGPAPGVTQNRVAPPRPPGRGVPAAAPLPPHLCANCGFWQRHFAAPAGCPVCLDFRHTPPPDGFRFGGPAEVAGWTRTTWHEDALGVVTFANAPALGIGPRGYLVPHSDGNLLFESPAWYDPAALDLIAARGGVRWLAASHPHAYGALWQVQERFNPEVLAHRDDLTWTGAFRVTRPFDDRLALAPGLELVHVGGHFPGQSILHWAERRAVFAGDVLKLHFGPAGGRVRGVSTHKAFNRQVPLTHDEVRRYRSVLESLVFDALYTTFDACHDPAVRGWALALFAAQLAGAPFCGPRPVGGGDDRTAGDGAAPGEEAVRR